ncbi:MAG: transcriptional regulator [Candidatus Hodarchaeota archaeon]
MPTRRQTIAELLENSDDPLTAQDICALLDLKSRSVVYEDIEHLSKSVRNQGKRLLIRPASCGKCNYVFKTRKYAKRPSKCPKCRSQWILEPGFLILSQKHS